MEKIRAFIAIELPEEVKVQLRQLQERLKVGKEEAVKWVEPEGIHLTLKFLGNVAWEKVEEISRAASYVAGKVRPFVLWPEGLGAFPNLRIPRVVWVGVSGDLEVLLALQKQLEQVLSKLGFEKEKAFSPHLTLGRVREKAPHRIRELLGSEISELEVPEMTHFKVTSLSLMRSMLTPGGARYTRLSSLALANQGLDDYTKNRVQFNQVPKDPSKGNSNFGGGGLWSN